MWALFFAAKDSAEVRARKFEETLSEITLPMERDLNDEIAHLTKQQDVRRMADLQRRFNLREFREEEWEAFSKRFSWLATAND
jgi:hypothetical protein